MIAKSNERAEERWLGWWKSSMAKGDAMFVYQDLVTRYSESHRAYHTLAHIEHCLDEFDQVRHYAHHPQALAMAIWYHDAVYDTHANDNEKKSADLARAVCERAQLSDEFAGLVTDLILATRHAVAPTDDDAQLLVDIDLAILGQNGERFDEYEQQIREEYAWVSEDEFIAGRAKILKEFLARRVIYSTRFFKSYELPARTNLERSIRNLEAK